MIGIICHCTAGTYLVCQITVSIRQEGGLKVLLPLLENQKSIEFLNWLGIHLATCIDVMSLINNESSVVILWCNTN